MLDIGWSEMAVIALVALVVIGPKDLPKAMKTVAFWVRKARKLASEFHSGVDQLLREAELEEARETIRSASRMKLDRALEQTIDPTGDVNKALQPPTDADLSTDSSAAPATAEPKLTDSPALPDAAPASPEAATAAEVSTPAKAETA
ncbi:MAG TPA: Sec-independent protein translocase protein TatB [Alphaproteobacteria bacterium]|nr:Sec-independent protein translocase protein TatB [Alphaproteobacteria bacterium]